MLAAGPILLASTSELSWTQSDYSFWHKHSSFQERTSLPQAQPRSTLSSLRVGTSWEALSSLVSPTNPEKKDRPGWVHLNWREVTYPPPPSNLHSGWGRYLTFHCLLFGCFAYIISLNLQNNPIGRHYDPLWPVRKSRLREVISTSPEKSRTRIQIQIPRIQGP